MNIWRVEFIERYATSSGMHRFNVDTECSGYVVTQSDSMSEVAAVITSRLHLGSELLQLRKAEFLGRPFEYEQKRIEEKP